MSLSPQAPCPGTTSRENRPATFRRTVSESAGFCLSDAEREARPHGLRGRVCTADEAEENGELQPRPKAGTRLPEDYFMP